MKKKKNDLKKLIDNAKNILLVSHKNPDGDNIGSILALGLSLIESEYNATIANVDPVPSDYTFLKSSENCKPLLHVDLEKFDLLIVLDCSDLKRVGDDRLLDFKGEIVNIDHHKTNERFGNINLVDHKACATGEIVFKIIKDLNLRMNLNIAEALYTAISTDSGSFKYSSVTPDTHRIIANLIEYGINVGDINVKLYQNRSLARTKLFIKAYNTIQFYESNSLGIMVVTKKLMDETNTDNEDTEGLINFLRDIEPIEIAILLREINGSKYKVSFRSKGSVDVSELASLFGGGGHKQASGATINMALDDAIKTLIEEGRKVLND